MIQIFSYLKPQKKRLIGLIILLAIMTLAELGLPTLMSDVVDEGINNMDMKRIITSSLLMLACAAVGFVSMLGCVKLYSAMDSVFAVTLREAVFEKANSLGSEEFGKIGVSALITRSTEDIWRVQEILYVLVRGTVTIPTLVIGGSVLALSKDVLLSLILFAFAPIIIFLVLLIGKKILPLYRISDEYIDKQNAIIRERLTGIRVIRAFNREEEEGERAHHATDIMAQNIIKANVTMGILNPVSLFILNFVTVLILYVGTRRIQLPESILSAGDIIAIIQYVSLVMAGVMELSFSLLFLPRAKVNCERICEVLNAPSIPVATDLDEPSFSGAIKLDNVSYSYPGSSLAAIEGITMDIPAGSRVAIIGGTGSGKSTVVRLLQRFYAATEGGIYYDGVNAEEMSAMRVRNNISCVLQRSTIFAGTIRSNITMVNPDTTQEELDEACRIAQLDSYIASLEKGYDHEVLSGGTNLSGGQKQRIAIARAVLRNAPIYIFDDTFSALDFLTESKLRTGLNKLLAGKTQIVITQRVTSAMNSDIIFVLDNGRLIGAGKHAELVKNCDVYHEIYQSQTGGCNE